MRTKRPAERGSKIGHPGQDDDEEEEAFARFVRMETGGMLISREELQELREQFDDFRAEWPPLGEDE